MLSENEVLIMLSAHVRLNYKSRTEAAQAIGCSRIWLEKVLAGQGKISDAMLEMIGVENVTVETYKKIKAVKSEKPNK